MLMKLTAAVEHIITIQFFELILIELFKTDHGFFVTLESFSWVESAKNFHLKSSSEFRVEMFELSHFTFFTLNFEEEKTYSALS